MGVCERNGDGVGGREEREDGLKENGNEDEEEKRKQEEKDETKEKEYEKIEEPKSNWKMGRRAGKKRTKEDDTSRYKVLDSEELEGHQIH